MKPSIKLKIPRSKGLTTILLSQSKLLEKRLTELVAAQERRYAVITDSQVHALYSEQLEQLDAKVFTFPTGEAFKSRETKAMLEDLLLSHHFGRDSCLIGLGGGVVCDLVGFLASTYCRGVPLILIPTTLLAMVDASIGGKTAVNTPYGKNTIGAFYLPQQVWIDAAFLKTLPLGEMRSGIVEVIKYGLISSKELIEEMRGNHGRLESLDLDWLIDLIYKSIIIKVKIAEEDPFEEKGHRRILNYGHTIGHALEKLENYALPHGQAVAMGILVSSYISCEMGFLKENGFQAIRTLFEEYQIPLKLSKNLNLDEFFATLMLDKKTVKATPRFVLLREIGDPHPFDGEYCTEVPFEVLEKAFAWMNKHFASHLAL